MSNTGNSYYTQQYDGSVLDQYSQSNATQSNPVYQTPNTATFIANKPHYYDNNAITNKRQKLDEELSFSANPYSGQNIDFPEPFGTGYPSKAGPTESMPAYRPLYYGEAVNRFRDSYRTKEVIDYTKDVSLNSFTNSPPHSIPASNLPNRAPLLPPPVIQSTAAANSFQSQANNRSNFSRLPPNIRPAPQSTANFTNASARNDSVGHQASDRPPLPNQTSGTPKGGDQFRNKICYPFQNDGIIITHDKKKNDIYYCGYCDVEIKRYPTVANHITNKAHNENKQFIQNVDCITRGFNKNFFLNYFRVLKFKEDRRSKLIEELNRVPLHLKHFYKSKGIRIENGFSPDTYFCIGCRKQLPSVIAIESHLLTGEHKLKEDATRLYPLVRQSPDKPIIGLQHINEYNGNPRSKEEVVYECTLCQFTADTVDMYSHIYSFEHRVQLLHNCSTDDSRKTYENTPQMHQIVENEIRNLKRMFKLGRPTQMVGITGPPLMVIEPKTVSEPNDEQQRRSPSVEVIRDATHLPSVIAIEGHLLTKKLGALVRLTPEKPIIGLQHIIEYNDNPTSKQEVVYECTLCQFTADTADMYSHIYTFKHRVQLLRECFPNDSRNFCENTPRMHQLVENEIRNFQKMFKLGKVKKKFGVAAPPMSNFEPITASEPNDERQRRSPRFEVIRDASPSESQSKYSFNLMTDEQASEAAIVIQSLKLAIIKYYMLKMPHQMRNELMRKFND